MKLGDLLKGLHWEHFSGDPDLEIQGVTYDSRSVGQGYLFVALRGHRNDGHVFLKEAVARGAAALAVERLEGNFEGVSTVRFSDTRWALAQLAVNFYDRPYEHMNLIGITGTNGKTTTSYLLESILKAADRIPGVIGTINYRFPGYMSKASVTTPESLDLMRIMRKMANHQVTDVVMEVSSHALDQGRTRACPFRVGVFTNLSRDHLDYHSTTEAYFEAKSKLFAQLEEQKSEGDPAAVVNLDDPRGEMLKARTKVAVLTYGLRKECDIRAEDVHVDLQGVRGTLVTSKGKQSLRSSLIGGFNIYNMLAASGAAMSLGIELEAIAAGIETLPGVPGRLEWVENRRQKRILVDYAHTPDALAKSLNALRPMVDGRLICVFGCGGDRDKGKRKEMGRIAAEVSDWVIVTSDNPRTEAPEAIISQIEEGVQEAGLERPGHPHTRGGNFKGYQTVTERAEAIRMALEMATGNDLVLIAGKGHETYQIIGREIRDFDDRKVAAEMAF